MSVRPRKNPTSTSTSGGESTDCELAMRCSTKTDRQVMFVGSGLSVARIQRSWPFLEMRHIPGPGRSPVTNTSSIDGLAGGSGGDCAWQYGCASRSMSTDTVIAALKDTGVSPLTLLAVLAYASRIFAHWRC